ncbi:hypothetical protein [Streptomyces sp. DSM 15324]|uniref:hypothetical protein n=1 Tax=Streptomyces sp. DSM 15324 TaxID=1739111 RepID=UPI0007473340|nr:hypothetical protein [Streptomyces sp. DSM 15324]KUO13139.1 hypothetical protein AQJ58_04440 [Streptomyces sp. DSM 15324]
MTIQTGKLTDPAVRAFVNAVNDGDQEAFLKILTEDATMADDGTDRDMVQWIDREIFTPRGHMDVVNQSNDGHDLVVNYRNDTWGEMRTRWHFDVTRDGHIARFETGQA